MDSCDVEKVICKVNDLEDNQMKEFDIPNAGKILLVKQNGKFSAVGSKCTHYGAPLEKGVLCNGRIRCPWHGACFDVASGDIEDYPGLDSLPTFEVLIEGENVKLRGSVSSLRNPVRSKTMTNRDAKNESLVLIVGGGAAGQTCAEVLRQEGFTGRILMATKEKDPPYDRPKLSKAMDADVKSIYLRPLEFFANSGIELLTNKEVVKVDILQKEVTFNDSLNLKYDQLLIATGARPNTHNVSGSGLANICLLRTPKDASYIYQSCNGKDVIVVGASFIGMETASCIAERAKSVTVFDRNPVPFLHVFGEVIGVRIKELFEENGVSFRTGLTIQKYEGKDGKLTEVVLSNGERLKADLAVVGLGVSPATDFVSGSGIPVTKNGFVIVDSKMKTEAKDVFAAGDAVQFPLFLRDDENVSIGHWQMAHAHGRIAALNILNKGVDIRSVPYFWSVMFKKSIRYAGFGVGFDDMLIDGDLQNLQFVAYYIRNGTVVAVASMNSDPIASKFAEYLNMGKTIDAKELRDDPKSWLKCF